MIAAPFARPLYVMLNKSDSQKKITVGDGVQYFSYNLPARSVISFKWAKKT